jgi:hypothetical protein
MPRYRRRSSEFTVAKYAANGGDRVGNPWGFALLKNESGNHGAHIPEDVSERVTFLFPATIGATRKKSPYGIAGGLWQAGG